MSPKRRGVYLQRLGDLLRVGPFRVVEIPHPVGGFEHLTLAVRQPPAVDDDGVGLVGIARLDEVFETHAAELKSSFLSDKADHDDDEMDEEHEEDYDDKGDGDADAAAETSKSDDAEPNFKGSDGSESAAVAKDAGGSTSGLPSYAATIEEDT